MKGCILAIIFVAISAFFVIQYVDFGQDDSSAESNRKQTKVTLSELRNRLERVEQEIAKEKEEMQEIIREEVSDSKMRPFYHKIKPYKERIKELEKERSKLLHKIERRE